MALAQQVNKLVSTVSCHTLIFQKVQNMPRSTARSKGGSPKTSEKTRCWVQCHHQITTISQHFAPVALQCLPLGRGDWRAPPSCTAGLRKPDSLFSPPLAKVCRPALWGTMKTTMVGHQWNAAPMVGTPRYHASMEQKVEPLLHKRGGHLSRQQTTAAFLQGNPFRSHLKLSKRLSSRITRQQHMPLVSQCAICVCIYI